MAAASGHHLIRINLSDQTDIMDSLLGADLPASGGEPGAVSVVFHCMQVRLVICSPGDTTAAWV
jgi:midasin (ATPase involved in ribosome maturation)